MGRFNNQGIPPNPFDDAGTARADYDFGSAQEYLHMQLGARVDNPGHTVNATDRLNHFSIADSMSLAYHGSLINPDASRGLLEARFFASAAPPAGRAFTLKLQGTVVTAGQTEVDVKVDTLQAWPSHLKVTKLQKTITLDVPVGAPVSSMELTSLTGLKVAVWTMPALPTLDALTGAAYALSAQKIELR